MESNQSKTDDKLMKLEKQLANIYETIHLAEEVIKNVDPTNPKEVKKVGGFADNLEYFEKNVLPKAEEYLTQLEAEKMNELSTPKKTLPSSSTIDYVLRQHRLFEELHEIEQQIKKGVE